MSEPGHLEIRATLVALCNEVGFPSPRPEDGIAAWADECLDGTLLRGAPAWQRGHKHVLAALESAALGNGPATKAALEHARDVVKTAPRCTCNPAGPSFTLAYPRHLMKHGKKWCMVCKGHVA